MWHEHMKKEADRNRRAIGWNYHVTVDRKTGEIKQTLTWIDYEMEVDNKEIRRKVIIKNILPTIALSTAIAFLIILLLMAIPF